MAKQKTILFTKTKTMKPKAFLLLGVMTLAILAVDTAAGRNKAAPENEIHTSKYESVSHTKYYTHLGSHKSTSDTYRLKTDQLVVTITTADQFIAGSLFTPDYSSLTPAIIRYDLPACLLLTAKDLRNCQPPLQVPW